MSMLNTYNNENIIARGVIAGLLGVLNNDIRFEQAWANDDVEEVKCPWYYNQSGDERFMQDFYTHYADCNFPRPIDGNFDAIPRGVITYTGASIDSNRITNRFVKARYLKLVDGKLESFVSFMYSIPLTVKFDCELWVDNQLLALKIEQAIRETFYKTITFYMYYKGMRLGATAGFPEDYMTEKNINYSFEPDNRVKMTFNVEVETYQPVFDQTAEIKASNNIKGFAYNAYQHDEKSYGNIIMTEPSGNMTVPKGYPLWMEWNSNREGAIINRVNVYWSYAGANERNLIESSVLNNEYYVWNIPEGFNKSKNPIIMYEEDSSVRVRKIPTVSVIPNLTNNEITAESFSVLDPGYFNSDRPDSSIGVSLEMRNDSNRIVYSPDNTIWANIINYRLDSFLVESPVTFPATLDYKVIDVHVANTMKPTVYDSIKNITVV